MPVLNGGNFVNGTPLSIGNGVRQVNPFTGGAVPYDLPQYQSPYYRTTPMSAGNTGYRAFNYNNGGLSRAIPITENSPGGAVPGALEIPLGEWNRFALAGRPDAELASIVQGLGDFSGVSQRNLPSLKLPGGGDVFTGLDPRDQLGMETRRARMAEAASALDLRHGRMGDPLDLPQWVYDYGQKHGYIPKTPQQQQQDQQNEFQASLSRQAAAEQQALQMAQRGQIERQFAGSDERAVQQGINRGFAGQFGPQPTLQQGRGGSYIPNLIRRGKTAFQQALASIGASDTDAGIPINSGTAAPTGATAFASPTDYGYSGTTGSAPVETSAPPPAWGGLGVFYGGG